MEIASIIGLACFITACLLAALTGSWFNENVACKALNDVSQPIYASVCQVGLERQ
jgi:hypothetical protein